MHGRAPRFVLAAVLTLVPAIAGAQALLQPTPPPLVTADNETWYLAGDPVTWSGDYYLPAGPQVFFNGNHMVRSGSYRGIPLYTDATLEPYSIVYVPLNGGLMQPYERRRAGERAGTVGSTAPSFPVQTTGELLLQGGAPPLTQALGAPTFARAYDVAPTSGPAPRPAPATPTVTATSPPLTAPAVAAATGTEGRIIVTPAARPLETARRPKGINNVWIDYDKQRWFSAGPAVALDGNFAPAGQYHGFTVYIRDSDRTTVYLPTVPGYVAPYARRP
jgi:hypothetical protein